MAIPQFARRFLIQFSLTLCWGFLYASLNSFSSRPLAIKAIYVLAAIGLMVGLLPGSYLQKALDRLSRAAMGGSKIGIMLLALLCPIFFGGITAFMICSSYEALTSPWPWFERMRLERNIPLDMGMQLFGLSMQLAFLISNSFFLIRQRIKTQPEV